MSTTDPIENTDLLPEPLDFLANDLKEANEAWAEGHEDTIGAEEIRKDGFTRNHRKWINNIARRLNAAERIEESNSGNGSAALDKWDNEDDRHWNKEGEELPTAAHALIANQDCGPYEKGDTVDVMLPNRKFVRVKPHEKEEELVRRIGVVEFIKSCYKGSDGEGPQPEDTPGKNFDRGWDAALSLIADRISGDLPASVEKKSDEGGRE